MKLTEHHIKVAKSFCKWADSQFNNKRLFDPLVQLEENGKILIFNQGRYKMELLNSVEIQVSSLISPWRRRALPSPYIVKQLIKILKWSIEDHFALTYEPDDQKDFTKTSSHRDPKAKRMGPNDKIKKDTDA
jgi:hypothetical protein